MMCVEDRDTNFRPHNNRTDNLFPVLLYIVPKSLQPGKHTHMNIHSALTGYLTSGPVPMKIFLDFSCCWLMFFFFFFAHSF